MFKVGDKVYHIKYGWGIIQEIAGLQALFRYTCDNLIGDQIVDAYDDKVLCFDLLSFTEYTLQGFTQKRPIILPEVGELCLVRNGDDEGWIAVVFKEYLPSEEYPYKSDRLGYKQLKRIKILD